MMVSLKENHSESKFVKNKPRQNQIQHDILFFTSCVSSSNAFSLRSDNANLCAKNDSASFIFPGPNFSFESFEPKSAHEVLQNVYFCEIACHKTYQNVTGVPREESQTALHLQMQLVRPLAPPLEAKAQKTSLKTQA